MLVDEIIHYEPRRETPPAVQVMAQEASPIIPIPGPSTPRSPRTLKKPRPVGVQCSHYYHPSPSSASSFAHPRAALGHMHMASDASDSPIQSPSSSRKLLKSRQGSTAPLISPSFPSPSSPVPVPQASTPTSRPVSPFVPPPIPQIRTSPLSLPDQRVRSATQFRSLERSRPESTLARPLLDPLNLPDTSAVENPLGTRTTGVDPPLVPRYSEVKNKRWALWGE